ncbi:MAG: type I 3-dehydroquinate dehydratase [Caldisphaera sp.]|nr:MAG: 3-dehydroquinate dehydratase [Caldisphaera sp.]
MNRPKLVLSVPYNENVYSAFERPFDFIEIRLDYKKEKELNINDLEKFDAIKNKVIVTIRDKNEGGIFEISDQTKLKFLNKSYDLGYKYDVEVDFARKYNILTEDMIVSTHYLNSLPSFNEIMEKIKNFKKAFTIKIAVKSEPGYKLLLMKILELIKDSTVIPLGTPWQERLAFSLLGSKLFYSYLLVRTGEGQPQFDQAYSILNKIF